MNRFAAIAVAIAILAVAGIHDAVRATRLSSLQSSGVIQAKLDAIPLAFGDWTGEAQPFDERFIRATHAVAWSYRRYSRGGSKPAKLDVLILAGDPGEIGAHDPERCYGGGGYNPRPGSRVRKTIADGGDLHSLWSERFDRDTLPAAALEVAWGWTDSGHWLASDDARSDYAGRGLLYKIYVSRALPAGSGAAEAFDPTVELMSSLAPLARTALAGANP